MRQIIELILIFLESRLFLFDQVVFDPFHLVFHIRGEEIVYGSDFQVMLIVIF